jgi:hypothetical protein
MPFVRRRVALKKYGYQKTTLCRKEEHQNSREGCATKENDRAPAKKDPDCSWQRRSQGRTKET